MKEDLYVMLKSTGLLMEIESNSLLNTLIKNLLDLGFPDTVIIDKVSRRIFNRNIHRKKDIDTLYYFSIEKLLNFF